MKDTKKPTSKSTPARKGKGDFAEMLSAVLRHPDCPVELYNAVADLDCMTPPRWDTPENIREALRQLNPDKTTHAATAENEKGGAK
jgi:hypothetical protein